MDNSAIQKLEAIKASLKEIPLSVCIITRKQDSKFLNGCLSMFPKGVQFVITITVPSDHEEMKEIKVYEENGAQIKVYEHHYIQPKGPVNKFNFSKALNNCISKADREWILKIDTDDRFCYINEIMDDIYRLPQEVGGVYVTVVSAHRPKEPDTYGHRETSPQVRMFRNKGVRYSRRVHEQNKPSIKERGLMVADSPLMINHIGYFGSDDKEIKEKYLRNINLLCQDVAEAPDGYNMTMLISHCHELKVKGLV